MFMNLII